MKKDGIKRVYKMVKHIEHNQVNKVELVGLINSHTKMQDVGDVQYPVAKGFRKMIKKAISDYVNDAFSQSKSIEEFK